MGKQRRSYYGDIAFARELIVRMSHVNLVRLEKKGEKEQNEKKYAAIRKSQARLRDIHYFSPSYFSIPWGGVMIYRRY